MRLLVNLIGGLELKFSGTGIVPGVGRKASALIAYLALSSGGHASRERLAGLLWSDNDENQARASLRQVLRQLRKLSAGGAVQLVSANRDEVFLIAGTVHTDLLDVHTELQHGRVPPVMLYEQDIPDRILYGFENIDGLFDAWLRVLRKQWRDTLLDSLVHILRTANSDVDNQVKSARAIINIDPTNEEARRFLIHHNAKGGNVAGALEHYNQLWQLLSDEYDMEPSQNTQDLIVEIKRGDPGLPPSPIITTRSQDRVPVVGIAAIDSEGGKELSIKAIILRRELIACLIRFREWTIVEMDPAAGQWADPATTPADYLLEGSLLRSDSNVSLIITVRECATGKYVWSERLSYSGLDWAAAQQDVVRRLSIAMNVSLSADRMSRGLDAAPGMSDAYGLWLQGQQEMLVWTSDAEHRAEMAFRQAIQVTPDFAPAYSGLANISNSRHFKSPGVLRSMALSRDAMGNARTAVSLDPLDTRNQLSLAFSNAMIGRFEQAAIHFQLTQDLNQNCPTTLVPCAHGLSFLGRHNQAVAIVDQAVGLNPALPLFHWAYVSCIRYLSGNYQGAVEAAEASQGIIPDVHAWHAAALAQSGDRDAAARCARLFFDTIRAAWSGPGGPELEDMVVWFLHAFPIRFSKDRENLAAGLAFAGMPDLRDRLDWSARLPSANAVEGSQSVSSNG